MADNRDLYRFLDAKFDAIDKRMDKHEEWHARWLEEGMIPRVEKLERWRSYMAGAGVVILAILTWLSKRIFG